MEPSVNRSQVTGYFYLLSLSLLLLGLAFGVLASLQYVFPGLIREYLSFERTRPMHVSPVIFWIILTAAGTVFNYLSQHTHKPIYSKKLLLLSLGLFGATLLAIFVLYLNGIFGGREYWEFPPLLAIPIGLGWFLMILNFVLSLGSFRQQPVYIWMWITGFVFFLFTFLESYLWIFPYFRSHVVNDMTIQWKSYGSMVGCWNMLIYGSSIFLMDKITGNQRNSHSRIAFTLYYIGLFNLMFNWGHHIYTLPGHRFVQYISYGVSMTELLLLGRIIYHWRDTLTVAQKFFHRGSYRFLMAADAWIFLNLTLAILMSVPAINLYTHGTHVTVAHTMGTTIGINTMLLLAFVLDYCLEHNKEFNQYNSWIRAGFWLANFGLLIFWISFIAAGMFKSQWQMDANPAPFRVMMDSLRPFFISALVAGTCVAAGLEAIVIPALISLFKHRRQGPI
ncbi:MAG: cbb3-type cytochrome c oxidase subunit I [Cyclobacteriaceae bacterium]|nr:cbb3-type cytochrome c oxidase subunit I [Cyclobacteriaceae bacterium]